MENVLQSFQVRARVPLESFCTFSIILVFCIPSAVSSTPTPFTLCGHVYATPPVQVYVAVVSVCIIILSWMFCTFVFRSLSAFTSGEYAVLVPTTVDYSQRSISASYAQQFCTIVTLHALSVFILAFCGIFAWYLGSNLPSCYLVFPGIGAAQVLNIFLGVFNAVHPLNGRPTWYKFLTRIFTVLVTVREYGSLDLESKVWNTSDAVTATVETTFRNQTSGAIFDHGASRLFVCGSGNLGILGRGVASISDAMFVNHELKSVQVNKEGLNFRLIPARVPYALVWYGIYGMLLDMDAYVGAEEVDKCIVWLFLVSAVSEGIVRFFPGPAMVVEAEHVEINDQSARTNIGPTGAV